MKLKAVIQRGAQNRLQAAIESMWQETIDRVIGPCLKRPNFGPAEFYIQECDFAVSPQGFCEVRLSGVSLSYDRSDKDFDDARIALEMLYREKIEQCVPTGERIQLMVSIMLDGQRKNNGSSLVEGDPVWVDGKCTE